MIKKTSKRKKFPFKTYLMGTQSSLFTVCYLGQVFAQAAAIVVTFATDNGVRGKGAYHHSNTSGCG